MGGRLLLAGHRPSGEPNHAYIAYSDDYGRTFTEVENSPFVGPNPFLVAMMIQMGRAYKLNREGDGRQRVHVDDPCNKASGARRAPKLLDAITPI